MQGPRYDFPVVTTAEFPQGPKVAEGQAAEAAPDSSGSEPSSGRKLAPGKPEVADATAWQPPSGTLVRTAHSIPVASQ